MAAVNLVNLQASAILLLTAALANLTFSNMDGIEDDHLDAGLNILRLAPSLPFTAGSEA